MKKLLALLLALMLVASTAVAAFAQTDDTATPDEAEAVVTSLEFTKLPDKLVYTDEDITFSEPDESLDFEDLSAVLDALMNTKMIFDLDLTGAELMATYSDGTTEAVAVEDCNVYVADACTFSDLFSDTFWGEMPDPEEDEDAYFEYMEEFTQDVLAKVYRDYTVNAEYKGATASYQITLEMPDFDDEFADYMVVSYTAPTKTSYTKDDLEEIFSFDYDEETDEEYEYTEYSLDVDTTGSSAVLMDLATGELITVDDTNIYVEPIMVEDTEAENQVFTATATAFVEDEDNYYGYADFEFDVIYNETETIPDDSKKPADKDIDSSTKDTAAPTEKDNNAVQTGSAGLPVALIIVAALSALGGAYIFRKRTNL